MIRDRRPEDLAPLDEIVSGLVGDPRSWFDVADTELCWVYDMAPVHVAPTRNVVGHVLVYRPTPGSPTPDLARQAGRPAADLLAIGRLVVARRLAPGTAHGILRHLLTQARTHIEHQGRTAVLDVSASASLTQEVCERYGFTRLPSDDPAAGPMVHTGVRRRSRVSAGRAATRPPG